MKEYRTWGPPGTGKTSWVADMATSLSERFGPDQISICSLTNAAVGEIASRNIPIDLDNMTTLHARCKRALNAPPPAESRMRDFAAAYPEFASEKYIPLYRSESNEDILASGATLYDEIQIARQQMIPFDRWRADMKAWHKIWSRWCMDNGLMDYSSWLEVAKDLQCLPPQSVVFVDEAQDHTPLQLATIRSWDTRHLILVGDDDQSLYEWSGSVPKEFLALSVPAKREKVLEQSFRVPHKVYDAAIDILSRISNRKVKAYKPTKAVGSVLYSRFSLGDSREALIPGINDGEEHMVLTSCAYMLNGIIAHLKNEGVPFHNPYRRSSSKWNPLRTESAIASRCYLAEAWTGSVILNWMRIMSSRVFKDRGGLTSLCKDNKSREISYDEVRSFIVESLAETLLSRRPEALLELRDKSVVGLWDYYGKIFKMNQPVSPKVIVGTIHSVKGGEAETVHIFPDMSASGYVDMRNNPDRIHRLFYVAITRAQRSVILHDSDNSMCAYSIGRRERNDYRN